ncbi:DUF402 domain-containing protein [Nocardia camponoti]|uniref:DUF402 domain-containing protein n=1 Tax=Nocardia camponoti TaxID=1616106 RepID=A0A917QTR2_9NOCA|nr:DUF402 domain-containing protein [Nocardia camponoti]GGK67862.1 hypothetical protein GCM10011591_45070 [Nocardia camponoti]
MTQPASAVHIHPPKVELFDTAAMTNTDPKGFVREVEVYREEPWGLYMGRHSDHPHFHYIESWLLPDLSLRASKLYFNPGVERLQDIYIDIGTFTRETPTLWRAVDHYLDVLERTGRDVRLIDIDELLVAHSTGLLDATEVQAAIETATNAIDGIAANGYSIDAWLASKNMTLTWR